MFVVAAHARQKSDDLRAITSKHKHECAAFHGEFGANLQVIQSSDNFLQIARALVFIVIGKMSRRAVAVVDHFVARALQPLYQPRRSQRCGRFLAARQKRGRARWRTNQGNLLRLTDDFDRQG